MIEVDGVTKTLVQWSRNTGIPETTITDRLERGTSIVDTLTTPPLKQEVFLTWNGKTQNLTTWAKELNVSSSCLTMRIKKNWSIDQILSPNQRPRVHS